MNISAAVGPEVKPVTCCREDVRAVVTLARENNAVRTETKRIFAVRNSSMIMLRKMCIERKGVKAKDHNLYFSITVVRSQKLMSYEGIGSLPFVRTHYKKYQTLRNSHFGSWQSTFHSDIFNLVPLKKLTMRFCRGSQVNPNMTRNRSVTTVNSPKMGVNSRSGEIFTGVDCGVRSLVALPGLAPRSRCIGF